MTTFIRVDDREVLAAFAALQERAQQALEEAALAAAEPIVLSANAKAIKPVVETKIIEHTKTKIELLIGVPKEYFYVAIFETGAQAHEIKPRKMQALAFENVVVGGVNHPGVEARPFLRPAYDENERNIPDIVEDKLVKIKI